MEIMMQNTSTPFISDAKKQTKTQILLLPLFQI